MGSQHTSPCPLLALLHAGLESELAPTRVGLLLLVWLKEAHRVGRRAAALREHKQQLAEAEQQLAATGQELEGARAALVGRVRCC
jgi:hypothetical protein